MIAGLLQSSGWQTLCLRQPVHPPRGEQDHGQTSPHRPQNKQQVVRMQLLEMVINEDCIEVRVLSGLQGLEGVVHHCEHADDVGLTAQLLQLGTSKLLIQIFRNICRKQLGRRGRQVD